MNSLWSSKSVRSAARAATLFGTASFIIMAGASVAHAQQVAQAPVEEILITGSLIRGAPAVGVPVSALSEQDFAEVGALTITEVLASIPALDVRQAPSPSQGGGRLSGVTNVQIIA